jgi:hypothetical protein
MSENNIISTTLKSENNNFPSKKQRLDNILSFPSLMGFGTFMVETRRLLLMPEKLVIAIWIWQRITKI